MPYYKKIIRIFTRDRISFFLLIINYTFIIFILYNFAELVQKIRLEEEANTPYEYQKNIELIANDTYNVKSDTVDEIISLGEEYSRYNTRLILYIPVGDGISKFQVDICFNPEELTRERVETFLDTENKNEGVYIGESILPYTFSENDKTFIIIAQDIYEVKGIYQNSSAAGNDQRIAVSYYSLTENGKEKIESKLKENLGMEMYVSFMLGSDEDISTAFDEFGDRLNSLNISWQISENEVDASYQNFWYKTLNRLSSAGMLIFAFLDCYAVTTMWVMRRKREFLIRKALGAGVTDIIKVLVKDIIKYMIVSVPLFMVMELVYKKTYGEDFNVGEYELLKYIILTAGIFVVFLFSLIGPLISIHKMNPAEGLGGD